MCITYFSLSSMPVMSFSTPFTFLFSGKNAGSLCLFDNVLGYSMSTSSIAPKLPFSS